MDRAAGSQYERAVSKLREGVVDTPCASCAHFPNDLVQTAAELRHNDRLASLGTLIAGVAHELSNPAGYVLSNLAVLKLYGDRLGRYLGALEDGAGAAELRQLKEELRIDRILADIESLVDGTIEGAERIHSNVTSLGRYATPQQEEPRAFDLCETVRTAVAWVSRASENRVPVTCDLPAECIVTGRSNAAHQVLINLLQNAVDATAGQSDATLTVSVTEEGERVDVAIRDNGPGLAAGNPDELFLPFVTSKPAGEGTGLGLSISRGLAHQEGGKLSAANHPDGGAVFTLSLPREAPDAR